jgi:hypothetical protein
MTKTCILAHTIDPIAADGSGTIPPPPLIDRGKRALTGRKKAVRRGEKTVLGGAEDQRKQRTGLPRARVIVLRRAHTR